MKFIRVLSAIAVCILGVAAFAPQAKADATPSGFLDFACSSPTNTCTGTVSGGQGGPWTTTGIGNLLLSPGTVSFPVSSNMGDELGDTYTLVFDTSTMPGTISITDASDGDFTLSGTIQSESNSFDTNTGDNTISLTAVLDGFPADGPVKFNVNVGSGAAISADLSVLVPSPEPASLLLLGTGLLGLGGAVRRRLFQS